MFIEEEDWPDWLCYNEIDESNSFVYTEELEEIQELPSLLEILVEVDLDEEICQLLLQNFHSCLEIAFLPNNSSLMSLSSLITRVLANSIRNKFQKIASNYYPNLTIYYAHSKQIYYSPRENQEIVQIKYLFPYFKIINPSNFENEWKISKFSEVQIMKKCLKFVNESNILIFSDSDKELLIGLGVYEEIKYAKTLNKPVYFLFNNKLYDFKLKRSDSFDFRYLYKVEFYEEDLVNISNSSFKNIDSNDFDFKCSRILKNTSFVNFRLNGNPQANLKILIEIINYCLETHNQLIVITKTNKDLWQIFRNLKLNTNIPQYRDMSVIPLIGKRNLCLKVDKGTEFHSNICESCNLYEKSLLLKGTTFFKHIDHNYLLSKSKNYLTEIKSQLGSVGCPYFLIRNATEYSSIIITNHAFIRTPAMRHFFNREIIRNFFLNKVIFVEEFNLLADFQVDGEIKFEDFVKVYNIIEFSKNSVTNEEKNLLREFYSYFENKKIRSQNFKIKEIIERFYFQNLNMSQEKITLLETFYRFIKEKFSFWKKIENKIIARPLFPESIIRYLTNFHKAIIISETSQSMNLDRLLNNVGVYKVIEISQDKESFKLAKNLFPWKFNVNLKKEDFKKKD